MTKDDQTKEDHTKLNHNKDKPSEYARRHCQKIHYFKRGVQGWGGASNSEHLPVFRAPCEGEARSAPVHGQGTFRTSPPLQKNRMGRGQTDRQTDFATTRPTWPRGPSWWKYLCFYLHWSRVLGFLLHQKGSKKPQYFVVTFVTGMETTFWCVLRPWSSEWCPIHGA